MKVIRALLLVSSFAFALGVVAPAYGAGADLALSFDLESATSSPPEPEMAPEITTETGDDATVASGATQALPIPPSATEPPLAEPTADAPPVGVYGGDQALALGDNSWPDAIAEYLPEPPPLSATAALGAEVLVQPNQAVAAFTPEPVAIAFTLEDPPATATAAPDSTAASSATAEVPSATLGTGDILAGLFQGGTESLVARAVGSAEGTRTPEGHRTPAYFGHVDPGNGVWNLGTFSYQHGADSPEDADERQLRRLQQQTQALRQKAQAQGLTLSEQELINGIDLANQAPLAALDRGGYIDWLAQARTLSMPEEEAIVWARTRSFLDPDTQRWNAPGLGNNVHSITRDQSRRAEAIARALAIPPANTQGGTIATTAPSTELPTASPAPDLPEPLGLALELPAAPVLREREGVEAAIGDDLEDLETDDLETDLAATPEPDPAAADDIGAEPVAETPTPQESAPEVPGPQAFLPPRTYAPGEAIAADLVQNLDLDPDLSALLTDPSTEEPPAPEMSAPPATAL